MNRLEEVRKLVNNIVDEQRNIDERRCGYYHLYGVSASCGILALRRGLNDELCSIAGMLHDISYYKTGISLDHQKHSSIEARNILKEINYFDENEIDIICNSIAVHSNKNEINDPYAEVLKDADVLQHYIYNIALPINKNEKDRLKSVLEELGVNLP